MDSRALLPGEAQHQLGMKTGRTIHLLNLNQQIQNKDEEEEEEGTPTQPGIDDDAQNVVVGGYNREMPPADDVCPICFDGFTLPCRSNCGHWFCASCILQFWMFRYSIQPCKCPLCCCRIVNLRPETSELVQPPPPHDDNVEILKKVHQYNGLYITGVLGTFHRMQALPLFMGRIFRVLIDPDGLRCIYYIMRLLGLFLALLYERGEFEFMASGGMEIQRMFDMGASAAVVILFSIGFGYRWLFRGRVE